MVAIAFRSLSLHCCLIDPYIHIYKWNVDVIRLLWYALSNKWNLWNNIKAYMSLCMPNNIISFRRIKSWWICGRIRIIVMITLCATLCTAQVTAFGGKQIILWIATMPHTLYGHETATRWGINETERERHKRGRERKRMNNINYIIANIRREHLKEAQRQKWKNTNVTFVVSQSHDDMSTSRFASYTSTMNDDEWQWR